MLVISVGGRELSYDTEWKGRDRVAVSLLATEIDKIRERITEGSDPDPNQTALRAARRLFPDLIVIGQDRPVRAKPGVVY